MTEKIVTREFELCHKLANEYFHLYLNLCTRSFTRNVSNERFIIFIYYKIDGIIDIDNEVWMLKK